MRLIVLSILFVLKITASFSQAAAGQFVVNEIGNDGILCADEQCVIQPLVGQTMPVDLFDPLINYDPGLGLAVFTCPPSYSDNHIASDPCFVGFISTQAASPIYGAFAFSNNSLFWNNPSIPLPTPNVPVELHFQIVTLYNHLQGITSPVAGGSNLDFDASSAVAITFFPQMNITITENCLNNSFEVSATEGDPMMFPSSFHFVNSFPSSANFPVNFSNGASAIINNLLPNQTVGFQIESTSGCRSLPQSNIFVGPIIGQIASPSSLCENDTPVMLNGTPSGGTWSGSPAIDNITGVFSPGFINIVQNTTYTLTYTPTNGTVGCNIPATTTITVHPTIESTISNTGTFCINDEPAQLNAASPNGIWSGPFNCITPNGVFNPSISQSGIHTIVYSIPGLCGTSSSKDITVFDLPVIQFTASDAEGCLPLEVTFDNTTPNSGSNYRWFIDQNPIGEFNATMSYTFTQPVCYNVGLALTDNNGCRDTLDSAQVVCPFTDPWIDFSILPSVPDIDQPNITVTNLNDGIVTCSWDFAGEANGSGAIAEHYLESNVPGEFEICLTAIDTNGCENSGCQFVPLISAFAVYAPTAFTPSDDGVNDAFKPVIVSPREVKSYEFWVFDKWGSPVFHTDDPDKYWYANNDGNTYFIQDDIYTWQLKVSLYGLEDKLTYRGNVLILR
jgi:PKD repeat protein